MEETCRAEHISNIRNSFSRNVGANTIWLLTLVVTSSCKTISPTGNVRNRGCTCERSGGLAAAVRQNVHVGAPSLSKAVLLSRHEKPEFR